ncbi:hypothetical protein E2542_SST29837 [Spatholobus suberectus]|nr:hypothetical protein E2542_SST29837 [Spatholobus suberectus]
MKNICVYLSGKRAQWLYCCVSARDTKRGPWVVRGVRSGSALCVVLLLTVINADGMLRFYFKSKSKCSLISHLCFSLSSSKFDLQNQNATTQESEKETKTTGFESVMSCFS